jgi:hypothetical protein
MFIGNYEFSGKIVQDVSAWVHLIHSSEGQGKGAELEGRSSKKISNFLHTVNISVLIKTVTLASSITRTAEDCDVRNPCLELKPQSSHLQS